MLKTTYSKITIALSFSFFINGCSTLIHPDKPTTASRVDVENSYLQEELKTNTDIKDDSPKDSDKVGGIKRLSSLADTQQEITLELDIAKRFSDEKIFQVSVNALPLNDFLHYTLGELLKVSYLMEPSVKNNKTPVTLELKEKVSGKDLFKLIQQVIGQNKINIALNNDIFFIHPQAKNNDTSNRAFGFGRSEESVPSVSGEIVQLVPLQYGVSPSIRNTLTKLVDAEITIDQVQGLMMIQGQRESVIRALSMVNMLDSATLYNKAVALISFEYIDSTSFIEKSTLLLAQQGIKVGSKFVGSGSVNFVPIEHLGQVVVFATSDEIIDKVNYWRKELDKPATGSEQSFYIYHPRYARAADLGQSLAPLIGGKLSGNGKNTTSSTASSTTNNQQKSSANSNKTSVQSIEGDNMRLVVDDRSNALIFYASGKHYQELRPIIRRLDVMPKQVMLEVVIAEVKLTGSFAKGVQFALKNGRSGSKEETFNFDSKGVFNYSIVGLDGTINVNLNQTDGLVNVLSRPSLLVRDGVSANISVGDDIPTIGSTTTDPINGQRQTTTIQYRKTGVDLTVTPTVNAQGTVIMTIEQNISSVSSGSGVSGTPAVFERKISTEVVSGNGQTVLLGGLISQNSKTGSSSVPVLGNLPVLGHLFRTDTEEKDKTELVVLVTPKIIENLQDWQRVKNSFLKGLENLKF